MNKKMFFAIGMSLCLLMGCSNQTMKETTSASNIKKIQEMENVKTIKKPELKNMGTVNIDLSKITVEVPEKSVITDEMIDEHIQEIREQNLISIDTREIQNGDTINIDYFGSENGKEITGGSATDYDLVIGSDDFPADFESQLIGKKKGDAVDIQVSFPSDYSISDLKGKTIDFRVTINDVKVVPELTDEFVKQHSETATTVDEYKSEIRQKLEKVILAEYNRNVYSKIIEKLSNEEYVKPSTELLKYEKNEILKQIKSSNEMSGQTLDDLINDYGMDATQFENEIETVAKNNANYDLIMTYFESKENIHATDENINSFLTYYTILNEGELTKDYFIQNYGEEAFNKMVIEKAVCDYLKNNVTIKDVPVENETIPYHEESTSTSTSTNNENLSEETETETENVTE